MSEPPSPARTGSAVQAHTTTVFAMLCDASVRVCSHPALRAALTLVPPLFQSEGDHVVKRAWRFQAPSNADTVDGLRIPLCLPSPLLDGSAGLELVFCVWGAYVLLYRVFVCSRVACTDARDGLQWVGVASGAPVAVGACASFQQVGSNGLTPLYLASRRHESWAHFRSRSRRQQRVLVSVVGSGVDAPGGHSGISSSGHAHTVASNAAQKD